MEVKVGEIFTIKKERPGKPSLSNKV